ncbi:MAG: riboflavin synthase [Alphaproteobacteria bacterium]|nr:riboflavin synthase [Alphaproteobacteria bacterium]MCL2505898.1 riboflavin synthase [Alphaproteobacteria bacterium]
MFTGIVRDVGTVVDITQNADRVFKIKTEKLSLFNTNIGASMCCSGVCLTVVSKFFNTFVVQASAETLSKTTLLNWGVGTKVNLEPALRLGDELGGHIVTGHVDGVAFVSAKEKSGDSIKLQFEAGAELSRFLAPKGSVTIDGVSLTINSVSHASFEVNIIPHTRLETTLDKLSVGDGVNLEIDVLARYLERLQRPYVAA